MDTWDRAIHFKRQFREDLDEDDVPRLELQRCMRIRDKQVDSDECKEVDKVEETVEVNEPVVYKTVDEELPSIQTLIQPSTPKSHKCRDGRQIADSVIPRPKNYSKFKFSIHLPDQIMK